LSFLLPVAAAHALVSASFSARLAFPAQICADFCSFVFCPRVGQEITARSGHFFVFFFSSGFVSCPECRPDSVIPAPRLAPCAQRSACSVSSYYRCQALVCRRLWISLSGSGLGAAARVRLSPTLVLALFSVSCCPSCSQCALLLIL
jgi:hypothetical protein